MRNLTLLTLPAATLLALVSCAPAQTDIVSKAEPSTTIMTAQDTFIGGLRAHCGKAYGGKLVSKDPQDADMADQVMTIMVKCSKDDTRIPFNVGENRSRTWVFTKTATGLRLKHQHNHKDGTEDKLSQYGGDTANAGTASRQEFPADGYSVALFLQQGLDVSIDNTWAVEITPKIYAYELRRPGRFFRVEFDLTKEIEKPAAPW